jgi:hypothetical protein
MSAPDVNNPQPGQSWATDMYVRTVTAVENGDVDYIYIGLGEASYSMGSGRASLESWVRHGLRYGAKYVNLPKVLADALHVPITERLSALAHDDGTDTRLVDALQKNPTFMTLYPALIEWANARCDTAVAEERRWIRNKIVDLCQETEDNAILNRIAGSYDKSKFCAYVRGRMRQAQFTRQALVKALCARAKENPDAE